MKKQTFTFIALLCVGSAAFSGLTGCKKDPTSDPKIKQALESIDKNGQIPAEQKEKIKQSIIDNAK